MENVYTNAIRESLQGVIEYYMRSPDQALSHDKEAVAVIKEGLRARAARPDGQTLVCDMPKGLGGSAKAPSAGGEMLAATDQPEVIEGEWQPGILVLIEFPMAEDARKWLDSPEYKPAREVRQQYAKTNLILID